MVRRGKLGFQESFALALAAVGSLVAGFAVARAPILLAPAACVLLAVLAFYFPTAALKLSILATTLHYGLFLEYRVSVGGLPVSLIDLVAPVVFIGGVSLRSRAQGTISSHMPPAAHVGVALMALGLIIGVGLAVSAAAESYQVLRVVRIELELLLILAAAVIAARVPAWRSALVSALYWAGILSAVQIAFTFSWSLVVGSSFWAHFPFGEPVDVDRALAGGNVTVLETIALSPYAMLFTLAFSLIRLKRHDYFVICLMLVASATTLSRGFWVICAVTVLVVLLGRWSRVARPLRGTVAVILVAGASVTAILFAGGDVIERRLAASLGPKDLSANFRRTETDAALAKLGQGPVSIVFGLGAGTIIEHSAPGPARLAQSPILENTVLARWANFTLLSILGCALLAALTFRWAWRALRSHRDAALASMALPVPVVMIGGLFSNTLFSIIVSGLLLLIVGTALAGPSQSVGAAAPGPRSVRGWPMRKGFPRVSEA